MTNIGLSVVLLSIACSVAKMVPESNLYASPSTELTGAGSSAVPHASETSIFRKDPRSRMVSPKDFSVMLWLIA
jgi:hypothetical protein